MEREPEMGWGVGAHRGGGSASMQVCQMATGTATPVALHHSFDIDNCKSECSSCQHMLNASPKIAQRSRT